MSQPDNYYTMTATPTNAEDLTPGTWIGTLSVDELNHKILTHRWEIIDILRTKSNITLKIRSELDSKNECIRSETYDLPTAFYSVPSPSSQPYL